MGLVRTVPDKTVRHSPRRLVHAFGAGKVRQMNQAIPLVAHDIILLCDHIFLADGKNVDDIILLRKSAVSRQFGINAL